jgi:hypothetical protein
MSGPLFHAPLWLQPQGVITETFAWPQATALARDGSLRASASRS